MQDFKKKGLFSIALIIVPVIIYFFIFFLASGFSDNIFGISYKSYRNGNSKLQIEESKKNTSYSTYYANEEEDSKKKEESKENTKTTTNEESEKNSKEEKKGVAERLVRKIYDNAKNDFKDSIKLEEVDQEKIDKVTQLFFQ